MRNFTKSISREHRNISCIPRDVASWIKCRLQGNIDAQQYHVRILFLPLSSPFFLFVCTKSRQYWQYLRKSETSLWGRLIKPAHPRSEANGPPAVNSMFPLTRQKPDRIARCVFHDVESIASGPHGILQNSSIDFRMTIESLLRLSSDMGNDGWMEL